ncbi:hypothetical protein HAX54_022873 [Datura stramonium]|uniref:Uncharacterized protein n=1 Tax=Datura stramonium TaxID=4076 RepID=A0ABS8UWB7_DATST|nr:hypothetical protein [Datura stramonium]
MASTYGGVRDEYVAYRIGEESIKGDLRPYMSSERHIIPTNEVEEDLENIDLADMNKQRGIGRRVSMGVGLQRNKGRADMDAKALQLLTSQQKFIIDRMTSQDLKLVEFKDTLIMMASNNATINKQPPSGTSAPRRNLEDYPKAEDCSEKYWDNISKANIDILVTLVLMVEFLKKELRSGL